ncbi:DgyrCDS14417 [Dimorphilus gyrociliatus]|uniref:DgyrCDS14417 n=1 Tax=Dimorphilus gyrociliatus TaxID=2664684 RepID=A0A7I8WDJ0_9ANNE|nr:DgyrCDS14417 [Dimorphilus gyrociliatus]
MNIYILYIFLSFFQLTVGCTTKKDCLNVGNCQNGVCVCQSPFNYSICDEGLKYFVLNGTLSGTDVFNTVNPTSSLNCLNTCTNDNFCEAFELEFDNIDNTIISCSGKTTIAYPILPVSTTEKTYYTIIFKDKKESVCGSSNQQTNHILQCIEYLWTTSTKCPLTGYGLLENQEDWMKSLSISNIENAMKVVSERSKSKKFILNPNSQSYRNLCYGTLSPGQHNVALNRPITFRGEITNTLIHSKKHLVDGVKNSNLNLGGCTVVKSDTSLGDSVVWIAVELTQNFHIRKTIIYLSDNQTSSQTVDIFVLSQPPNDVILPPTDYSYCSKGTEMVLTSKKLIVECEKHVLHGRYVALQSENLLKICELEIYTSNLAIQADVLMSSVQNDGHFGGYAVDGLTDTNSKGIHGKSTWTSVFLGAKYLIYGFDFSGIGYWDLEIFSVNRNFYVEQTVKSNEKCRELRETTSYNKNSLFVPCEQVLLAMFVVLKSPFELPISQIEVFGLYQNFTDIKNLAERKPVWLSSVQDQNYPYYATDGFSKTSFASVATTDGWMIFDLLAIYKIEYVGVKMRARDDVTDVERYFNDYKFFQERSKINEEDSITASDCEEITSIYHLEYGKIVIWNCSIIENIGRFVLVKNSRNKRIEIYEFYTFGKLIKNEKSLYKILLNEVYFNKEIEKNIFQPGRSPLKVIDGDFASESSCVRLSFSNQDSLTITFHKYSAVQQILIQPRQDSINNFKSLNIFVGNQSDDSSNWINCANFTTLVAVNYLIEINCFQAIIGDLVRIEIVDFLNDVDICEIQLFSPIEPSEDTFKNKKKCSKKIGILKKHKTPNLSVCNKIIEKQTIEDCITNWKKLSMDLFSYNFLNKTCCLFNSPTSPDLDLIGSFTGGDVCVFEKNTC